MKDIYVIGYFDEYDYFIRYVRKGRNCSISAYDSLESAKRGLAQSRTRTIYKQHFKLINFTNGQVVEV